MNERTFGKTMAVIITLMSIGMAIIIVLQIGIDLGWFE
jgi:hypothetical protein